MFLDEPAGTEEGVHLALGRRESSCGLWCYRMDHLHVHLQSQGEFPSISSEILKQSLLFQT